MDLQLFFIAHQSRRDVLRTLDMLAGISFTLNTCISNNNPPVPTGGSLNSINHVLIACQENRTFDTYFGYDPLEAFDFNQDPNYYPKLPKVL